MYFRRFYDERLAQASYLIGCQANGDAIVIDPAREVTPYLEVAAAEGLRIRAVTETHIHADFLSGLRELAAATGATQYLSACGPAEWQYGFRGEPSVVLLQDGDRIAVGNVRITAVHTPGHTPEHLVFLVTDGAASDEPMGVVTGDFVFVGDVGRPDLLEKAARVADTAEIGARQLWRSLAWFRTLPDHLQVWPGHGAGSACGKGLGAVPTSTVGYEKRVSWAFGATSEGEFVRQVLAGQPEPPKYFGRMKVVNRDGPPILGPVAAPARLAADRVVGLIDGGALVVDCRPTVEYATGFIPGTVNIPFSKNFVSYAGSLLPYDTDLWFIALDGGSDFARQLQIALASIGFDRVGGVIAPEAATAWTRAGRVLGTTAQLAVGDLRRGNGAPMLIDVRNRSEWDTGHIAGASLIPLPELMDRLGEVPRDRAIVVHCQGGGRSAIAASVLKRAGHRDVSNLEGGFSAWVAAGGPIAR
ncbi:MAG: MBL fold metallo-hydrolase [Gemmatimonadetes bacterium]|nr:MBL fold metallo-hydrolase [Gemmatimonadota bacterium]